MTDTEKWWSGRSLTHVLDAGTTMWREWRRMAVRIVGRLRSRDAATTLRTLWQNISRHLPGQRSLAMKIVLAGLIFIIVPLIIYDRLGEAERDKAALLFLSAREQGRLIALNLEPLLEEGTKSLPQIDKALSALASDNLNVRILFRPKTTHDGKGFYYIASSPPLTETYLESEISKLAELGILSRLSASCSTNETVGTRIGVAGKSQQLISAIVPVATADGCWSIIISYAGQAFLHSSFGRPYWQSPEMQFASLLYFSAAGITLLILTRISAGLRGFRDTAVAAGRTGNPTSFAARNENPDLNDMAQEFDSMVQRIGLLSFAVERSPIAVAVAGSDWRLEYVNAAYEKLSGQGRADLLGFDLRQKEFESLSELSWEGICEQVAQGDTWHGQIRRQKPDGRTLWAEVSLYRLVMQSPGTEHFVCLQEDVTERQRILNGLIEEKERALSLNRMKSNFIAHMSHEFRTPLNAILGFSEIISSETFGPCGEKRYVEYAGHIHSSGQHLLSLINDILDLSKLESGKESLHLEPVNLSALVVEMERLVQPQALASEIRLDTDDRLDGLCVVADERAIKQVLLNLLSNAVKFTPRGGSVTVAVMPWKGGRVKLTVADTGCGIAEEDIPKICEPYARADTDQVRNTAGTGLGLPIVKRLVELQNGSFAITSAIGKGTTVEVVLPAAPAVQPTSIGSDSSFAH